MEWHSCDKDRLQADRLPVALLITVQKPNEMIGGCNCRHLNLATQQSFLIVQNIHDDILAIRACERRVSGGEKAAPRSSLFL